MKNRILLGAGLLAAFTAAVHTFMGTPEIHAPILNSSLDKSVSLLLYACWHLVTFTLILSAIALIWSSGKDTISFQSALPIFIGIMWLSFGLVFIAVALIFSDISALWTLPQWTLLLPTGGLALRGSIKNKAS